MGAQEDQRVHEGLPAAGGHLRPAEVSGGEPSALHHRALDKAESMEMEVVELIC